MVQPYSNTGTAAAWKKSFLILSERPYFRIVDNK